MSGSEIARILQKIHEEGEYAKTALHARIIVAKYQLVTKRSG